MANRGFALRSPPDGQRIRSPSPPASGICTLATPMEDQIAGVEWAIKERFDRNRIGVFTASYGGYSTLMVMVMQPDLS